MASLQAYKGKGKQAGKTFYRIQPYLPDGRRVTIRLGTGQKQAEKARQAIEDLIGAQRQNVELNTTTKAWLENANDAILSTLRDLGLDQAKTSRAENWTLERLTENYIRVRSVSKAESTKAIWRKAQKNLFAKFGRDRSIKEFSKQDAREFFTWLIADQGYSANTAKQRLRYARSFFEQAVEDGILPANAFKVRGQSVTQTAATKTYVLSADVERIIDHTGNIEWRLLFALCRKVPIRVPSEIQELTWSDVDFERGQILIHSPKTRSIGKAARLVPLFAELKPFLDAVYFSDQSANYVFETIRKNKNAATYAKKLVEKAKIEVWDNFFNSLRASAETDLMDEYGIRKACQWAGNSVATAMKNYALVKVDDFADMGSSGQEKSTERTRSTEKRRES